MVVVRGAGGLGGRGETHGTTRVSPAVVLLELFAHGHSGELGGAELALEHVLLVLPLDAVLFLAVQVLCVMVAMVVSPTTITTITTTTISCSGWRRRRERDKKESGPFEKKTDKHALEAIQIFYLAPFLVLHTNMALFVLFL